MPNPFFFIVGCPRSGTTLLRRMVDAHPQIAVIPEIGWLASRYEGREGLTKDGLATPELARYLRRGLGRYTPLPMSRPQFESLLASGAQVSYAALIALLFDLYGGAAGKRLVGNKTVDLVRSIATLHELWPHAKFVHLIRDGRDVCLSATSWRKAGRLAEEYTTWSEDPVSTAALWWEWQVRLGREAGSLLPAGLYYEIRYESLVREPATECAALCAYLGVQDEEAMLRFYEGRMKLDNTLDAKHAWLPPTPGLRDWRLQMPAPDLEQFEAVAGQLLDELGYPRSVPCLNCDRLEHARKVRSVFAGRPLPQRWQTAFV